MSKNEEEKSRRERHPFEKKRDAKGWINIHSARICVQYILLHVVLHDDALII